MAKILEAMQRSESAAGSTAGEEALAKPTVGKPISRFPEYQDGEEERCRQELIAHLNRFTPMKQPMKMSEKIANFFKVTKS